MDDIKMLALTQGAPFSKNTYSGTTFGVLTGLKKKGILVAAEDVEPELFIRKALNAVGSFSFNKEKWRQKYVRSDGRFNYCSKKAARVINDQRSDVNCVLQMGALFSPLSSAGSLPPVISYHDSNIALSAKGGVHSFSSLVSSSIIQKRFKMESDIYHGNDLILTFSDYVKRSMVEDFGVSEEKIKVVYAGSNLEKMIIAENKSYDENVILFVGKDFERKGGKVVLEAFQKIKKSVKDVKLIILGADIEVADPAVEVYGFVDKNTQGGEELINEIYQRASVFVMPSFFEPFGIVFCEAMFHKLPCVGSNICAMPEIVKDGESGFLIEPGNSTQLAEKVIEILLDKKLAHDLGHKGYEIAHDRFTWDRVADRVVDAISAL